MRAQDKLGRRWRSPTAGQVAAISFAAALAPLRLWATNMVEVGLSVSLLLWTLGTIALGLVLWVGLVWLGLDPQGVTYSLFWSLLAFGALGRLRDAVPGGSAVLLLVLALIVAIAYRLRGVRLFQALMAWVFVFVALVPGGLAVASLTDRGPSVVESVEGVAPKVIEDRPDVVILVFDGQGSHEILKQDYGADVKSLRAELAAAGITVVQDVNANYSLTHLSLSSFFEMGYPVADGVVVSDSDWIDLLRIIGGDNNLVARFRSEGYRFTLVKSGWSAIGCGASVDFCVAGAWPDQATRLAYERSLLGWLDLNVRPAPTAGALNSFAWLRESIPALLVNEVPDLVFAHVMVPHPPMYLTEDCEYQWAPGLGGYSLGGPHVSDADLSIRMDAYLDQSKCGHAFLADLAGLLGGNGVIVALGDHGPDSRGQLFKTPVTWSEGDHSERFGTLLATNLRNCGFDEVESLVNVGRVLLGCLSGSPVNLLEDRYFISVPVLDPSTGQPPPLVEVDLGES